MDEVTNSRGASKGIIGEYLKKTFGLLGKIALITGSSEGLGEATAIGMACAGAKVAVTSIDGDGLETVVSKIRAAGSEALSLGLELRNLDQLPSAVEKIVKHFGRIDILVNNASFATRGDSLTYPSSDWDRVMEVNMRGAFYMAQAVAPHMIAQGGGRIINISTGHAHTAMGGRAAYASSKAGLEHITRILSVEWARHQITVNVVAPTTMLTPTRAHVFPTAESLQARVNEIPMAKAFGRLQVPEDVVPSIIFVASDAGRFITGASIVVDGGFSVFKS